MKSLHMSGLLASVVLASLASGATVKRNSGVVHMPIKKNRAVEAAQLQRRKSDSSSVVQVGLDNALMLYYAEAAVGTPPQAVNLQIDTGSSDTWVVWKDNPICADGVTCKEGVFDPAKSSTYKTFAAGAFSISYVDNTGTNGDYFKDTFTIGGTSIKGLQLGLGVNGTIPAGLLGISYALNEASVDPSGQGSYPTVVDAMVSNGLINSQAYSLWLDDKEASTGSVLFGGIDTDKYEGDLANIPVYPSESGIFSRFTVALTGVSVTSSTGSDVLTPDGYAIPAILDSGTSLTILPDDLTEIIYQEVGAIVDDYYGPTVPCALAQVDGTFNFQFEGPSGPVISVPVSELVLPLTDGTGAIPRYNDGTPACLLGVQPAGDRPILLGDTFLRSAYVVYDLVNNRIGIAPTNFNSTSTHIIPFASAGAAIPNASSVGSGPTVTNTAAPDAPRVGAYTSQVSVTGGPTATATATQSGSSAAATLKGAGGFANAGTTSADGASSATPSATSTPKKNIGGRVVPMGVGLAAVFLGVVAWL